MDILKNRFIYLGVSAVFFVLSLFLLFVPKLNLGIDMTGGIQMEYNHNSPIDLDKLSLDLEEKKKSFLDEGKQVINNINTYTVTGEKTISVVVGFYNNSDEKKLEEQKSSFKDEVLKLIKSQDNSATESRYVNIGKSFGDYIKNTAILTLSIAILAISIYVTFAFSGVTSGISVVSFGAITILTLFFDVIVASGLYIFTSLFLPEYQIDTFFITALLTILGYSISDTIVIFDRIRSNLKKFAGKNGKQSKSLYDIINDSLKEVFTRSIYTSLTVLLVLITIFIFGPITISGFILLMIYGTIVGTFSSIFIASPILYEVNKNKKLSEYKKEIINPEDKIVV